MRTTHQYAVRYRREDWEWTRVRFFQSEPPALRFAEKLSAGGWRRLSPVVELWVERRPLGPVEKVWPQ